MKRLTFMNFIRLINRNKKIKARRHKQLYV